MTAAKSSNSLKMNGSIDIAKLVMAVCVIGMHTDAFGSISMLNKAFSIVRRLCVPFFFVASAYFFFRKEKSPKTFLKRITILYVIWSIIYLPFDISMLKEMSFAEIIRFYLWEGNQHALWYLYASIIGFLITYALLKILKPKYVMIIAIICFVIGAAKTTYSSAIHQLFGIDLPDILGTRNGLFYGFPFIAMGMMIAKSDTQGVVKNNNNNKKYLLYMYAGFVVSMLLLVAESYLSDRFFKSESNLLKLSVLPYTFFFFEIVLNTEIRLNRSLSVTFRKMSTLMYVSQFLFITPLSKISSNMLLFVLTVLAAAVFSLIIIKLSERKELKFLQYLY